MTLPPSPPLAREAAVIDLRPTAPPPPGVRARTVRGEGNEVWLRIDLADPENPSLHTIGATPPSTPAESYPLELAADEPLPLGLRRVSLTELDRTVAAMREASRTSGDTADVATAIERARSILRAVRTWIGENVYRSEDAVLGYATDAMAPLVTTEARLRHADRVAQHALHSESAAELTDSLRAERDDARRSSIGDRQFVADLVMTVSAARSRFASWPIHPGLTDESRRRVPIPDAFSSIAGGIETSYESGRRAFQAAIEDPLPERLLTWLTEATRLGHQLEIMHGAWPQLLGGLIASVHDLGDVLDTERRLGDLGWRIATPPWPLSSEAAQHTLILDLERRRFRLRRHAIDLGRRIYLESTDSFMGRMAGYWSVWRKGANGQR